MDRVVEASKLMESEEVTTAQSTVPTWSTQQMLN
jgi:hypothetical protein